MLEAEAVEYVRLMCDAASEPVIADEEIAAFMSMYRVVDRAGYTIDDALWTPTWHLPRVIAECWSLKVMRCAQWVDTSFDGGSFSASQAVENIRKQEARWRRRCVGSA